MSKQKTKKFKRNHKGTAAQPLEITSTAKIVDSIEPVASAPTVNLESQSDDDAIEKEYAYVRKDVRLILLTILLLVVLLIIAFILGEKTTWLRTLGDFIYKITNIQTS